MPNCFFVSDLHGREQRYLRLFDALADEKPHAVFLGGDLLPNFGDPTRDAGLRKFIDDFLLLHLERLRQHLGRRFPRIFIILGNDDPRSVETRILGAAGLGLWEYVHQRRVSFGEFDVYGYSCVPPSPFLLKDWEKYDLTAETPAGSVPPDSGLRTVRVPPHEVRDGTIREDLVQFVGRRDLRTAIMLFHAPPRDTCLDCIVAPPTARDEVLHVGSVAIRQFIEENQPRITLHGHIHESIDLTGDWCERIGATLCFGGAHHGDELALVRFDPTTPEEATRELV